MIIISSDLNDLHIQASLPNQCFQIGENPAVAMEEEFPAIEQFISELDFQMSLDRFHIHGWRWHTASLVRESGRLSNLAQRAKSALESDDRITEVLHQAVDYVVGFNMKGLHRIESDLMFPWIRERLTTAKDMDPKVSQEFASVMGQLENARKRLVELGEGLVRES